MKHSQYLQGLAIGDVAFIPHLPLLYPFLYTLTVKDYYLVHLAILSGLTYTIETIATIISEVTMYESSVVQYFTEKALKQGIEQGIEQGICESIQEVLELRFQPEAVRRLAARLGAIDDVQRLKQLFRAALQVPSLEAFRLLLNEAE